MSREEEIELIDRVQRDGDRKAADVLVRAHWPYVVKYALRFQRYGVPVEDLIAEAHVGLVHALGKFDPTRGVRFVTYAKHWMRACIVKHILTNWSIVSGGSRVLRPRWFFLLRRERARISNILGDSDAAEGELAGRLGLGAEMVREMVQRLDVRDLSLDATLAPSSPLRLLDQLPAPDNQEHTLLELQLQENLKSTLASALSMLDERERYIVEQRMMAETSDAMTLADIGRTFGVSRERARQLEVRAARKLRATVERLGISA